MYSVRCDVLVDNQGKDVSLAILSGKSAWASVGIGLRNDGAAPNMPTAMSLDIISGLRSVPWEPATRHVMIAA